MTFKRPLPWALAMLLVFATSPLHGAVRPEPAAGRDTVVIGTTAEPDGFHPLFHDAGGTIQFTLTSAGVISTIFTLDVEVNTFTGRPFAQGVESLPSVRDGTWTLTGERMTLRWKIKPRAWHDGRPVTCSDYVFTYAVMRNEQVPAFMSRREPVKRIANVACPRGENGREVVINWKERYAYASRAPLSPGMGVLPRHVLEPYYRSNPSRFDKTPYGIDPGATIGDGLYRWIEWHRGESLTLEAVPNHPIFGTPKIQRIIWRFFRPFPDPAFVEQLLSGGIDATMPVISFRRALELERRGAGRLTTIWAPGPIWEHVDFNLSHPMLQDVRVRRAIAHGVNRAQIVRQVLSARLPVSHSYLWPGSPGYTDDVPRYPYDPARARALLREAGFAPGADGIVSRAGQRLALQLSSTAGSPVREQVEQMVQEQLRQIGIEITILNYPTHLFFGEVVEKRRFTLAMYAWVFGSVSDCDDHYTTDGIPSERNGWAGRNYPGYTNQEMDTVCRAIRLELDEERRRQLFRESARIFARDLPALPLFYAPLISAVKVGLANFPGPARGTSEMWNVHTWYWR